MVHATKRIAKNANASAPSYHYSQYAEDAEVTERRRNVSLRHGTKQDRVGAETDAHMTSSRLRTRSAASPIIEHATGAPLQSSDAHRTLGHRCETADVER